MRTVPAQLTASAGQVQYVEPQEDHNFLCTLSRNRSNLDIGVLGYIGILSPKEHSPEVWHIPPGHPVHIL